MAHARPFGPGTCLPGLTTCTYLSSMLEAAGEATRGRAMPALLNPTDPSSEPCYVSFSITHAGSMRRINRDEVVERSDIGLWAVADSMGGDNTPGIGSATIARTLARLAVFDSPYTGRRLVRSVLADVNVRLFERAKEERLGNVGASTVVLLIQDGMYACLWAGNCRAYLLRDGELRQISQDHCVEESRASRSTAGYKAVLTRAIGSQPTLEIDAVGGEIRKGDRFLLCSDGALATEDVLFQQLVAADNTLKALTEFLESVLQAGARDNLSAVVVRV